MESYNLEYISRLETPITLNSETSTFDDVGIHAKVRQFLSDSTIDKNLRYARFMATHACPVDFSRPTHENFIRHMDYRLQVENASPHAIAHEWKAMQMFLRAYGIRSWDIRLPPPPRTARRLIPFPEIVREFWHYKYSTNRYERKLYQYLFFTSYLIGMRSPSELAILKTKDVVFNDNDTAYLTITETKKRSSKRTILLDKALTTDWRKKSLKNWLDSWRPRVENGKSDDYLFLQPDGKPFTVRHLGHRLSEQGKRVWPHFTPYVTRHWCAIARLIRTKIKTGTFDCYRVKNWLGHENIQTTMSYVKYAEQYYDQAPYDWIQRALTFKKEEESPLAQKTSETLKNGSTRFSNRRNAMWAGRDLRDATGVKSRVEWQKTASLVFQPLIKTLSFFFSLFQRNGARPPVPMVFIPSSFHGGIATPNVRPPACFSFSILKSGGFLSPLLQSDNRCRVFGCEDKEIGICIPSHTPGSSHPATVSHQHDRTGMGYFLLSSPPSSPPVSFLQGGAA